MPTATTIVVTLLSSPSLIKLISGNVLFILLVANDTIIVDVAPHYSADAFL